MTWSPHEHVTPVLIREAVNATVEKLRASLPVLEWLPAYDLEDARGDLTAGFTVGVMLIPQVMAYAVLAGVPPIYGLYASLVPLVAYTLLGTCRHLAAGMSAATMVIVAAGLGQLAEPMTAEYVGLAIVLAALVGVTQLAMGVARLGFVANLLSRPVIAGFTSAAAIIIAASQIGGLLGLELPRSQHVHVLFWEAMQNIEAIHYPSLAIGVGGIVAVLLLRRWSAMFPGELAVLAVSAVAAWALELGAGGMELVGSVPGGLPRIALPDVGLGTLEALWPTVIAVALVQFMNVVSLGRVFSARYRYTIEPNQELVAVGTANLLGSLFQAIPSSASFSRSAVNEQAGARTAASNVVAAALVGLTLLFLTPLFRYLPLPALAAIIMVAAANLLNLRELRELFTTKPSDGVIALFTFAAVLVIGIEEGILLGVTVAVLKIMYRISRPHVAELGHLPATRSFRSLDRFDDSVPIEGILILRVEAGFSFFNAKFFKEYILEKSRQEREIRALVIDGLSINYLDSTAVQALFEVVGTLKEWGVDIHFTGLTGPVRDVVERSGLGELVGENHFHMNPHRAVLYILEQWDQADDGYRIDDYLDSTELPREEIEPTSESPFI